MKKKFTYILVNGLIANFEFQSFLAKKVEFYPTHPSNFVDKLQIYSKSNGRNLKKIGCNTQKLVFLSNLKIRVGPHED